MQITFEDVEKVLKAYTKYERSVIRSACISDWKIHTDASLITEIVKVVNSQLDEINNIMCTREQLLLTLKDWLDAHIQEYKARKN